MRGEPWRNRASERGLKCGQDWIGRCGWCFVMFENPPLAEIVEAAVVGIHDPPDAWGNLLGLIVRHFVEEKHA